MVVDFLFSTYLSLQLLPLLMSVVAASVLVIVTQCCGCGKKDAAEQEMAPTGDQMQQGSVAKQGSQMEQQSAEGELFDYSTEGGDRKKIYEHLFEDGVCIAKKDYCLKSHPEIKGVKNLYVIKALKALHKCWPKWR